MFNKAMIAIDFRTVSFPLLKCVRGLKELGIKNFHIIRSIEHTKIPGINIGAIKTFFQEELDRQKDFLNTRGFNVDADILVGMACKEINSLAIENNCELMVFGSHGHTRISELLIGNITCDTVYNQVMPILLVKISPHYQKKSFISKDKYEFLNHVVFPTDFSKNADFAALFLKSLISKGPKKVTLLHIQNKTTISPHLSHRLEEFNKTDKLRLEELKEVIQKPDVNINIEILYGHPVKEIVRFSKANQASLIIMGSQGRGFLQEVFLGSVSQNVARCSDVPIMLVPAPERKIAKNSP
ncbi:universal stress protein [bacterium]|nr:universal stress protein [bacterium]